MTGIRRLLTSLLLAIAVFHPRTAGAASGSVSFSSRRAQRARDLSFLSLGTRTGSVESPSAEGIEGKIQVPSCKCGCCTVTYRTPDEMQDSTVFLKCGLEQVSEGTSVESKTDRNGESFAVDNKCPNSCLEEKDDDEDGAKKEKTFGKMAGESNDSPIDYNRFCFYNCRPFDFKVGQMCTELSKDIKSKMEAGTDPALDPVVTDPAVQAAWAAASGKVPPPAKAATTTTSTRPCEESDPCAYGMMKDSLENTKLLHAQTRATSVQAQGMLPVPA